MLEKVYLDDGQIILSGATSDPEVVSYLESVGCQHPEKLENIAGQIFLMTSYAWKDKYVPFFANIDNLWRTLRAKDQEPEHYFVIGIDQQEMESIRHKLKLYFALRSILKGLCHHEGDDAQPLKYVFFSSKESYLTKLEIPYAMDAEDFLSIEVDDISISRAELLKSAVYQEDDVHCEERKHVMREALVEFFKDEGSRNIARLMSGTKEFYKAYTERYKVYVSKFSVNKIISEIEAERLGFLCKVQDAIMSQQTKAFAIPGGVVAVGAILRYSQNSWDLLIIFAGLLITTWMVTSLNNNVVRHIDLLRDEFINSLSKYDDIVLGVEDIKAKIAQSNSKLESSFTEAKTKLSSLTKVSWAVLILVVLLLLKRSDLIAVNDFHNYIDALLRTVISAAEKLENYLLFRLGCS